MTMNESNVFKLDVISNSKYRTDRKHKKTQKNSSIVSQKNYLKMQTFRNSNWIKLWPHTNNTYNTILQLLLKFHSFEKTSDNWKPYKIDEKCFLFHVKSSFCSQDIYIVVLTIRSCRKRLDKKAKDNFKIYGI